MPSRRIAVPPALVTWTLAVALATIISPAAPAVAQTGAVAMERVEYRGWKHNLKLANGQAELIATLDVGPRIISYRLQGGKNVFQEYGDQVGRSGESEWMIRGGHRLWAGPEDTTRTYALDNAAVDVQELSPGQIRLKPAPDRQYGLQKEIDLRLDPRSSRVTLVHRLTNIGQARIELAPWALSVMAPGGVEIIPLPPKKPHPGSAKNASSPADFAPNQLLRLWPFTELADPRLHFGSRYITLKQDAGRGPTKLGLAHQMGWVGYLNGGTLFVKRFGYQPGAPYPDGGCNFETFTNQDMLEVESLGPLVQLAPGQSVEHGEHWELIGDASGSTDDAALDTLVKTRIRTE